MEDSLLLSIATKEVDFAKSFRTVSSYWDSMGGWEWDLLNDYLSSQALLKVQTTLVWQDDSGKDEIYWALAKDEKFSIKSAYSSFSPTLNPLRDGIWTNIWKLKIPQKI